MTASGGQGRKARGLRLLHLAITIASADRFQLGSEELACSRRAEHRGDRNESSGCDEFTDRIYLVSTTDGRMKELLARVDRRRSACFSQWSDAKFRGAARMGRTRMTSFCFRDRWAARNLTGASLDADYDTTGQRRRLIAVYADGFATSSSASARRREEGVRAVPANRMSFRCSNGRIAFVGWNSTAMPELG